MKQWPTHMVSAAGYILDAHGNVLLGKHPRRGWCFPGGQVETGESLEEAVLREIREECGVEAALRCLAGVYSNVAPYPREDGSPAPAMLCFDFLCDYRSGAARPSDECLEVLWAPLREAGAYLTDPVVRLRYRHLLAFDGRVRYCTFRRTPDFAVLLERYL